MSHPGRFVWHDLMTHDTARAVAFYTELCDWQTTDVPMGPMGTYTMIKGAGEDLGGIVSLGAAGAQIPAHWIVYIDTPDVDATCQRVASLGGQVCVPPTDIPNVGRFAVCNDPQGALFSPFKGLNPKPEPDAGSAPCQWSFCWHELLTSDTEGAYAFYSEVFGYGRESMDMGDMGSYSILKRGDRQEGGMMALPMPQVPPNWLNYIFVDDVDARAAKVLALGGQVMAPAMDIPNVGRVCVCMDDQGAAFALFGNPQHPPGALPTKA